MLINFNEIPSQSDSQQLSDSFELFARDFLQNLGFEIVSDPNRGADGKKDLIIKEIRQSTTGLAKKTEVHWLVSCKHLSKSKKSVIDTHEPDILDRVSSNECDGFLGFYSTIISSSLSNKLEKLKKKIEVEIFDKEKIENFIIGNPNFMSIFQRYFPESFLDSQKLNNPLQPVKLFEYFMRENYDGYLESFLYIFKETSVLIKGIRASNSIHELFERQNCQILVEPVLENFLELKTDDVPNNEKKGIFELIRDDVPTIFSSAHIGAEKENFHLFSMIASEPQWHDEKEEYKNLNKIFGSDKQAIYYLYPKFLFLNTEYLLIIEKLFLKMKQVLD